MAYKQETLEPIIVNQSKEIEAPGFTLKDIKAIAKTQAAAVLAELGDDVINKAIEDGKIVIPTPDLSDVTVIHTTNGVDEENAYINAKVGDIVVDVAGFVGIIKKISFTGATLTNIVITGIENSNIPTTYIYDGSTWTHTELSGGTNLYKHKLEFSKAEEPQISAIIEFVSTENNPYTKDDFAGTFLAINTIMNKIVSILSNSNSIDRLSITYIGSGYAIIYDTIVFDTNLDVTHTQVALYGVDTLTDTVTEL